jgi:hypothetical protein
MCTWENKISIIYDGKWGSRTIVKSCPATRHGGTWGGGERRYSSNSFLTLALDGG